MKVGSVVFFGNAAGHIRANNIKGGFLGDGAVLRMLEYDLHSVLPTWRSTLKEFWEDDVSHRFALCEFGIGTCHESDHRSFS
ncbi:hypothetical protein RHSIM_Rhsim03G0039200 [Rhododendron simsii]|uniref:Uncharacterized protein n=1 Tax=Rhododendron simsii TaxID=118357 RepID=A0A834HBR5_RHOSS|nr:hypothetical protein RHSIM_Rhsim03G0039200 [Rhododendron simsii]